MSILPESTPSGDGHLGYDNTTGEFTYTPPDLSGYLTSYTETDPVFSASAAASITNTKITNWDTAHGWGDHGVAGYVLTSNLDYYTDSDVDARLDSDLAGDGQILSWDDTNSNYVWVDSPTFTETVTSLNINANILTYTREDGTTDQYDLSLYLDDTNLARITSGTLDASTGIATFTRDDSSTFTLDSVSYTHLTLPTNA